MSHRLAGGGELTSGAGGYVIGDALSTLREMLAGSVHTTAQAALPFTHTTP